jgi:aminopeptidase-like protein
MLDAFRSGTGVAAAAAAARQLIAELYPICRSITGQGVRQTLSAIEEIVPLERTEVPSGTPVFDWEIPNEWNIRDAYVLDRDGRRVIDFQEHNLHVMSYSCPVHRSMTRDELEAHLHSLPDRPDWIPYRTSYYKENWGFCLRHRDRERLGDGPFEVVIDSTLRPGSLTYAECVVPGTSGEEAIVYTHICHPSLANDNLSGVAVAALLARELRHAHPRLTWRFVFGPGTIGSLAWLSRNEHRLPRVRAGLTIGLLGGPGPLTYKRTRRGDTTTDQAALHVLQRLSAAHRVLDFEPYGYDERQFCSPGFDLPVGRFTRYANGEYPEYHTSADNLDLIDEGRLAESLNVLAHVMSVLDANRTLENLSPKGEPRLGKRGLYGSTGGAAPGQFEHALLWVLSYSDGRNDLLSISERSGLDFQVIAQAGRALEQAGLVRELRNVSEVKVSV